MTTTIAEGLLREALAVLRSCGAGQNECVCWLTGPLDTPGILDEVLHPRHTASAGGYQIADDWLHDTSLALARSRRELRLQIHTHPGAAYHSSTDDDYPAIRTPGFLSLVIPRFAIDATGLAGAHLAELDHDGGWHSIPPTERLVIA